MPTINYIHVTAWILARWAMEGLPNGTHVHVHVAHQRTQDDKTVQEKLFMSCCSMVKVLTTWVFFQSFHCPHLSSYLRTYIWNNKDMDLPQSSLLVRPSQGLCKPYNSVGLIEIIIPSTAHETNTHVHCTYCDRTCKSFYTQMKIIHKFCFPTGF